MTDQAVATFQQSLRGRLIQPTDADYDAVRALYNGMIDKRPRLIARCVDVADVITAVNFAPRAGSAARDSRRRPQRTRARQLQRRPGDRPVDDEERARRSRQPRPCASSPAARSGDVDHATHAFGLAVPFGIVSTHRRRGPHARRRHRLSHAQVRPHDRQPARGRRRAGRRPLRDGERELSIRICSGRCAAAAATSASSRASCSRRIR